MFRRLLLCLAFALTIPVPSVAAGADDCGPERIYVLTENDDVFMRFRREILQSRRYRGRYVAEFRFRPLRYAEYFMKPGDSLQLVAVRFGISVDAIASASGIVFVHAPVPGNRLLVPNFDGISYASSEGCTLAWLAGKYDVTAREIRRFNNFGGTVIPRGGRVFIPGAAMSPLEQGLFYGTAFHAPLAKSFVTSGFGTRSDPLTGRQAFHGGVDLAAAHGAAVFAAHEGDVEFAGRAGGYGNLVMLRHAFGYRTLYGHLSAIHVRPGQRVSLGAGIGRVGSTGYSTGPHLHFEIHHYGAVVDPGRYAGLAHRDRPAAVPVYR